jgi:hypothetical protein
LTQRLSAKLIRSIALLAVVFALAFSGSADAQGQDAITLTARAGFDGICKQAAWIPVWVNVENTGKDLEARVEVSFKVNGETSIYKAEVSLPSSSRKELQFYVHPSGNIRTLTTSLKSGNTTLAATTTTINCTPSENWIVGLVADASSNLGEVGTIQPLSGLVRKTEINLADLPERVEGWEALDVLAISGVDTGALNREQRSALREWLARGGKLLVVGGPKWQAVSAGLDEVLPVQISATQKVGNLSALAYYLRTENPLVGGASLSDGSVREGANVLVEQDGIPLVVERQIGFGKVIYLAADPALQPLSDWDEMDALYGLLLNPRSVPPRWIDGAWDNYSANQALSTLSNFEIPSLIYILCWLGGYIALIGPINYLLLKRIRRNQLAWVSVPALALAFTVIAYVTGGITRGSGPILNRLAVVQAWEGQEQAQVRALVGLYSPNRATYTLQADTLLFTPFDESGSWLESQGDATSQLPEVRVEAGGMKSFMAEGSMTALSITHDLVLQISDKNPKLTGTVTNDSPYTLKNAVIVTQGYYKRLGDLPPGKNVQIDLSVTNGSSGPLSTTSPETLLQIPSYPEDDYSARQLSFLGAITRTGYLYETTDPNWGVYLMGWVDEALFDIELAGKQADALDTTFYVASLTPAVQFTGGLWRLSPGMFSWEGSNPSVSPYGNLAYSSFSGEYSLNFKPAISFHFRTVDSLTLHLNTTNSLNTPRASLWDFVDGEWRELENLTPRNYPVPDPSRFVGPNGEIRLQFNGDPNYEEIVSSYFTLGVRP